MEWQRHTAWLDDEGWKYVTPARHPYRVAMAMALVALATRIAPTVAVPNPRTPALAQ